MTQNARILSYLRMPGRPGITSMEAFQKLGVVSLQSRLSELRAKGYRFRSIRVTIWNHYDGWVKVNRYFLIGR